MEVPENPSAWLVATAKNRALDILRRERTARTFAPEMGRLLETEWTLAPLVEDAFAAHTIRDEQLRMMFSCCHPRLPEDAQLALILNILCGFGASEIASAFLTGRAAIEKRIARGKKVLAGSKRLFDLVSAASRQVDCLLVSCHWGPNWGYRPPPEHVTFGRALVDAGADIVAGHSPHIFRGIELYRGKPILYGTGDFIDDYAVDELERNDESFLFTVNASSHRVHEILLRPTLIRDFQARLAEPQQARRIATKMESLCAELSTRSRWDETLNQLRVFVHRS
jgi:hypothetical protein